MVEPRRKESTHEAIKKLRDELRGNVSSEVVANNLFELIQNTGASPDVVFGRFRHNPANSVHEAKIKDVERRVRLLLGNTHTA